DLVDSFSVTNFHNRLDKLLIAGSETHSSNGAHGRPPAGMQHAIEDRKIQPAKLVRSRSVSDSLLEL
ncbi:MAG TPA: hypothetical protein PK580_05440, partial [Nitrosomonas halophila]|nr:hypothetical protein [Nitrosomonas halophila]